MAYTATEDAMMSSDANRLGISRYSALTGKDGGSVLQPLRRLLLQGALRVALVAVTTAGVVGFLSLVASSSELPALASSDAKASSRACLSSQCRAKAQTGSRSEKR